MKKNIPICIILSIITCGLYSLYWIYTLAENTKKIVGREDLMGGGIVLLLSLITCGFFGWYWMYKTGDAYDNIDIADGLPTKNRGSLYVILNIFDLGIISMALIQSEINERCGTLR